MDDLAWKPPDQCYTCGKFITPKTGIVMVFKDDERDFMCFECVGKLYLSYEKGEGDA